MRYRLRAKTVHFARRPDLPSVVRKEAKRPGQAAPCVLLHRAVGNRCVGKLADAALGRISRLSGPVLSRWAIAGNTATSDKQGDTLWELAARVTGHAMDWPGIWPISMRSPKSWDERYWLFVNLGDKFDLSNLTLTTGPSATFRFKGSGEWLEALQALYAGTEVFNLYDQIQNLADSGRTPIREMVIAGHSGPGRVWGDGADFTLSGLKPEEPAPSGAGAHNKSGPHRTWFTRNATVRFVGCSSEKIAQAFAGVFLRKGAVALGTNHWLCGWHQTKPVNTRFISVEGPPCTWPPAAPHLNSAADVNAAAGLWVTKRGQL